MNSCTQCGSTRVTKRALNDSDLFALGIPVSISGIEKVSCSDCNDDEICVPDMAGLIAAAAVSLSLMPHKLNANEIKFCRKALGLNSKQLAEDLDVAPETVSRWENDKQPIGAAQERLLRLQIVSKLADKASDVHATLEEILTLRISPMRQDSIRPSIVYGARSCQEDLPLPGSKPLGTYKRA